MTVLSSYMVGLEYIVVILKSTLKVSFISDNNFIASKESPPISKKFKLVPICSN